MSEPPEKSAELLCGEILNEAWRECERIARDAAQEAGRILAAANRAIKQSREQCLAAAKLEAARRADQILATVPLEENRLRATFIEQALDTIRNEAAQRLEAGAGFDPREVLIGLAAEAIRQMPGNQFRLRVPAADAFGNDPNLAKRVQQRCGRGPLQLEIMADPALRDSGTIVEDLSGQQHWDNRLGTRLERLWPELRTQLAARTGLLDQSGS